MNFYVFKMSMNKINCCLLINKKILFSISKNFMLCPTSFDTITQIRYFTLMRFVANYNLNTNYNKFLKNTTLQTQDKRLLLIILGNPPHTHTH